MLLIVLVVVILVGALALFLVVKHNRTLQRRAKQAEETAERTRMELEKTAKLSETRVENRKEAEHAKGEVAKSKDEDLIDHANDLFPDPSKLSDN